MKYKILFDKAAKKDWLKVKSSNVKTSALKILKLLESDPYKNPPYVEKLVGDLKGKYARRINKQHRLVYEVYENIMVVKVLRMWTHYGDN